ncbi:hypothetical protein Aduo_015977 [Ancylostoma duodenale]
MKPPPPKKARAAGATEDGVRQIVAQALLSDDASCAALLERLNGFEKEIFDALMTILRTFSASKVNLHGPISKILKKYFAVIGVGTAAERFNELCDAVLHNIGTDYAPSFVFLLCQFINFCNIVRFDKLCRDVVAKLPGVIRTLWKSGLTSEACATSRLFMELLLSISCYHGDESFLDVWFEQVLTEELKRCPYCAVLSILLNSQNSHSFVDSVDFSDIQELSNEGGHSSPRAQMTDLILTYLPSLHGRCTERQLRTAVDFVLRHGFETNNVSFTIGKLINSAGAVADDTLVCQLVADSLIRLVLEQLSASAAAMLFANVFKNDDKLFAVCIRKMNALARTEHTALPSPASSLIEAFFDDCLNSLEGLSNVAEIWRDVAAALLTFVVPIKEKFTDDLPHRLCPVLDFVDAPASYSWAWRDVVRLSKRIIVGKVEMDKAVLECALNFYLKYIPSLTEGARQLEEMLNWEALLSLQRAGVSLDVALAQLPAEKAFGHTDVERDVVNLCFALASVQSLSSPDFTHVRSVQRVLDNAIRYAHPSVNNDQCAVFAQLLIKVFKAVQHFIINQCGTAEQVDELVHGLHSLTHALTIHKMYYSRIVGAILSAVIYQLEEIEFSLYKLHSISDKHSASLLATNLPPSERLLYKRVFTSLKRTRKLIV